MMDREPSNEWQRILDIKDEYEQGREATKYVQMLENQLREKSNQSYLDKKKIENELIDKIMKKRPFREWLERHDKELFSNDHEDWSGLK